MGVTEHFYYDEANQADPANQADQADEAALPEMHPPEASQALAPVVGQNSDFDDMASDAQRVPDEDVETWHAQFASGHPEPQVDLTGETWSAEALAKCPLAKNFKCPKVVLDPKYKLPAEPVYMQDEDLDCEIPRYAEQGQTRGRKPQAVKGQKGKGRKSNARKVKATKTAKKSNKSGKTQVKKRTLKKKMARVKRACSGQDLVSQEPAAGSAEQPRKKRRSNRGKKVSQNPPLPDQGAASSNQQIPQETPEVGSLNGEAGEEFRFTIPDDAIIAPPTAKGNSLYSSAYRRVQGDDVELRKKHGKWATWLLREHNMISPWLSGVPRQPKKREAEDGEKGEKDEPKLNKKLFAKSDSTIQYQKGDKKRFQGAKDKLRETQVCKLFTEKAKMPDRPQLIDGSPDMRLALDGNFLLTVADDGPPLRFHVPKRQEVDQSISPAEFSRASTAETLPWVPSPESNPPAKKAKSIPPCPPTGKPTLSKNLKRELFPPGEKPRPTTKAHVAAPVPLVPAKEEAEWTPPDPSTWRVPQLCPLERPSTPLRYASPRAKKVPISKSPPPPGPAAAKTHGHAEPPRAKQPAEPKQPPPCPAKAVAPPQPPPPPLQKKEEPEGTPSRPAVEAARRAPTVKATANPPPGASENTTNDASASKAEAASTPCPAKQPPTAKASVASPPSFDALLEYQNKLMAEMDEKSDTEIEVKIKEACNHTQFKRYMKHMKKEFGLEEKEWGTYEPREELIGFYVWLEEMKDVLTPSNVATPQNNHVVPAVPTPPVAAMQAHTPLPAAPPKATAAKAPPPSKTPGSTPSHTAHEAQPPPVPAKAVAAAPTVPAKAVAAAPTVPAKAVAAAPTPSPNTTPQSPADRAALKLTAGLDHSQALRPSGRLERPASYRKPTPEIDVGNGRDAESHAFPDLGTWLDRAVDLRAAYMESAAMANQLCKPKGLLRHEEARNRDDKRPRRDQDNAVQRTASSAVRWLRKHGGSTNARDMVAKISSVGAGGRHQNNAERDLHRLLQRVSQSLDAKPETVQVRMVNPSTLEIEWQPLPVLFPEALITAFWEAGEDIFRYCLFGQMTEDETLQIWKHVEKHCSWFSTHPARGWKWKGKVASIGMYGDEIQCYRNSECGVVSVTAWTSEFCTQNSAALIHMAEAGYWGPMMYRAGKYEERLAPAEPKAPDQPLSLWAISLDPGQFDPEGPFPHEVMQTKVMFYLIIFALGNMAIASLLNPAQNIIAFIAAPWERSLAMRCVYVFRRFFMNRNWRMTFVWTAAILALNNCFQLMVIYNAWGVGQDGWFYAFGSNILMIIQGIAQVLSSLAVVEISPDGYEASVYEFLTSIHNAGITLNSNLQNLFDSWWKRPSVGGVNLFVGGGVLLFSVLVSLLSAFPETNCLQIAGGPGC
eukprot:s1451_g12.t1